MKKLLIGAALLLTSAFSAWSQGLENVIVEKYYVADAADAAFPGVGALPQGSVTYRIYVDMLPGYKFQALYGVTGHELKINSTTAFFNNSADGGKTPEGFTKTQAQDNTVMLDSWFSVGGASSDFMGVLKTDDDGTANAVNANGLLANNDPDAGIALTTQDGFISGTPEAVTFVGLTTELDIFNATSQMGGSFSTFNGSIASLNGSVGPTAANRVLIGQFTTRGTFSFELNIQIGTPSFGVENYVANNPVGAEMTLPSLTYSNTSCVTPAAPAAISGQTQVCLGQNFIYTTTNAGYTYDWTASTTAVSIVSQVGASATTAITAANSFTAAVQTLSVTASDGDCGASPATTLLLTKASNLLPVNNTTTITPSISNICPIVGTTVQVTYSIPASTNAATYTWTIPAVGAVLVSGQGTNTIVVTYTSSPTGDIKVKAKSDCGNLFGKEIKLTPLKGKLLIPTITAAVPGGPLNVKANYCHFVNHGEQVTFSVSNTGTMTVSGATSYTWSIPANATPVGPTDQADLVVTFSTGFLGGEFKAAGQNGCYAGGFSKGIKVALPKVPVTPLLMTGPRYLCKYALPEAGTDFEIPPVSSTNSYLWSAPAGVTITSGQGTTKIHVTIDAGVMPATGDISVTAVSGCGNSAVARTYSVNKGIETPNITNVSGFNLVCPGTTTQYSVPAVANATAYNWSVVGSTTLTVVSPIGSPSVANTANIAWGTKGGNVQVTIDGCGATGAPVAKPAKPFAVKLGKCRMGVLVTDEMLSVYPNPSIVGNNIIVSLSGLDGVVEGTNAIVVIYDMLGKPVYSSEKGYNAVDGVEYEINTQNFSSGMYMITVQVGEEIYTQKLMLSAY